MVFGYARAGSSSVQEHVWDTCHEKTTSAAPWFGLQDGRWDRNDGGKAALAHSTIEATAVGAAAHGPQRSYVDRALERVEAEGPEENVATKAAGPRASGDAVRDAEGVHAHAGMQQSATLQECDREVEGLGHANVEGATREDEPHVDAMRRERR